MSESSAPADREDGDGAPSPAGARAGRGSQHAAAPAITEALIREMVRRIVETVDPEKVLLFGSRARGDGSETSDVDLIVLEAEPFGNGRSRRREVVRIYSALKDFPVPVDVLVYSLDEVEYWRDSLNHVLARALREGRVLHERPQVR